MDLSVLFISKNEYQSFYENIDPEDFLRDSINISSRLNGEDAKLSGNAEDNPVLVELDQNMENISSRLNGRTLRTEEVKQKAFLLLILIGIRT